MQAVNARFVVAEEDERQRLDLYLSTYLPELSRSRIQQLIREGAALVDERSVRPSYRVRAGDSVRLDLPEPRSLEVEAEAIPLTIVHEDGDVLVVDKPAGMTVHPAPGSWTGTLVNALLAHCADLSGINGVLRPGIVHRLDRDTTGLLVVAKNDNAHRALAGQLENRTLKRRYAAVVWGTPEKSGAIEAPIGRSARDRVKMSVRADGRHAVTHYDVREEFAFLSLLDLRLETGRTHQIRVHLHHVGHPVFGDAVYGGRNRLSGIDPSHRRRAATLLGLIDRQALHACSLGFQHPSSGADVEFESPLPADMETVLAAARHQ